MAMVVEANQKVHGIGGHISTYSSAATLYEVGFNHFFPRSRPPERRRPGLFPGSRLAGHLLHAHTSSAGWRPAQLHNFRREFAEGGGLSSYPHPWLMPDFWQFPTVSMGLGPIMAIYQARFMHYLEDRGLKEPSDSEGMGVPRRRRDGRAGGAGRDQPCLAREPRQPHLRRQLQPPAPRRAGARQRQHHPGTRSDLPWRRLERDQGAVGQRMGRAARDGRGRPARAPDGGGRRRRIPEVRRRRRRLHPRAFLRHRPAPAGPRQPPERRRSCGACASAVTTSTRCTPRTRPPSSTGAGRR